MDELICDLKDKIILEHYFIKNPEKIKQEIKYPKFVVGKYTRDVLYTDPSYDVIAISWAKDSVAEKHYHPKNGCHMKVLLGQLVETRYDNKGDKYITNILEVNESSFMSNEIGSHKVKANCDSVSIHIYSK